MQLSKAERGVPAKAAIDQSSQTADPSSSSQDEGLRCNSLVLVLTSDTGSQHSTSPSGRRACCNSCKVTFCFTKQAARQVHLASQLLTIPSLKGSHFAAADSLRSEHVSQSVQSLALYCDMKSYGSSLEHVIRSTRILMLCQKELLKV